MAYTKQTWQNEVLSGVSSDQALFTIKNSGGTIINDDVIIELKSTEEQAGSEFTADRMNHIEDGIESNSAAFDASTGHDHDGTDSKKIAYANVTGTPTIREVLTANRTYYVRTDGNNSNTGLVNTAGGAFLTIQKAVDVVSELDIKGKTITIQVGAGTYNENVTLKEIIGYTTPGVLNIVGDESTPSNVIINSTTRCFHAVNINSVWTIKGFKLTSSSIGLGVYTAYLQFKNIDFGACTNYHIGIGYAGKLEAIGGYTISGSSSMHISCGGQSFARIIGQTITVLNNVTINTFILCNYLGWVAVYQNTFALGSYVVTGKRYSAETNGIIMTNGGGATYLPGTTNGSIATGGIYV